MDLVLSVVASRRPVAVPDGVEWDRFVRHLEAHGIRGLAVAAHRTCAFLPPNVAADLEEAYLRTALHTTLTVEAGIRAREALAAAGIPAVLFKGAALMEAGLYADPGSRAMGDADLLVSPDRMGSAVTALRDAGFRPWRPWDPASLGWLDSASFTDERAPEGIEVTLDLHWRLGYGDLRYGPSDRRQDRRDDSRLVAGRPVPTDHLILLLEHLLKHLHVTTHLRGLGDVVRLSNRIDDWKPVVRALGERGTGRGLARILAGARSTLGATVPDTILEEARSGWWSTAGRAAVDPRRLIRTGPREDGRVGGLLRRWAVLGSPALVLREALYTTLPDRRWLRARYRAPSGTRTSLLLRYWRDVFRWLGGAGPSPVSPNQDPA